MRAMPMVSLIHSPLVGPLSWQNANQLLQASGFATIVPNLNATPAAGPPYYPKLARAAAEAIRAARSNESVVLIAHSGAGALLPAIAADVGPAVVAASFVDAILPHPGANWFSGAPPELAQRLRELARDGWLPPWDTWFSAEAIADLLPDPDVRAAFHADLPSLPLAYFTEPTPSATFSASIRGGYLLLSEGYREAADEAQHRGWRVSHLPSDHLAILTQPEPVVAVIEDLIRSLVPA